MPDDLNIFEQVVFLASTATGTQIDITPVNPYKTSSVHYDCNGKLLRNKNNWDVVVCKKCGSEVNTHLNAALNIRAGGITG